MDVNLLKHFDKAQDIDSLYKELLRNCKDNLWHWQTPSGIWHCFHIHRIGYLDMNFAAEDYIRCELNKQRWIIEKWMYNS